MMPSLGRDTSNRNLYRYVAAVASVTAGGSGDATAINGVAHDLQGFGTRQKAESVMVAVGGVASIASSQTLSIACKLQESANGSSGWTDITLLPTQTVTAVTGATTSAAYQVQFGFDLTKTAQRYVRVVVTPDASASGTDTATVQVSSIFGGLKRLV